MHRKGIAHRDLKPANPLLASREPIYIKVADLGDASSSDSFSAFCATKPYIAPEAWKAKRKRCTNKVDIWSVGVITVKLFFGLPGHPESHDDWPSVLHENLVSTHWSPIVSFILRLLQADPESHFFVNPIQPTDSWESTQPHPSLLSTGEPTIPFDPDLPISQDSIRLCPTTVSISSAAVRRRAETLHVPG